MLKNMTLFWNLCCIVTCLVYIYSFPYVVQGHNVWNHSKVLSNQLWFAHKWSLRACWPYPRPEGTTWVGPHPLPVAGSLPLCQAENKQTNKQTNSQLQVYRHTYIFPFENAKSQLKTLTVQLAGVAMTFSLSVSCRESITRRISLQSKQYSFQQYIWNLNVITKR
jgi:hypothetical protein